MLEDKDNRKIGQIIIPDNQWQEIIQITRDGIFRKLKVARKVLENDGFEVFSAGLYTYDLEEFGKYLLLKKCKSVVNDTKKVIIYRKNLEIMILNLKLYLIFYKKIVMKVISVVS